MIAFKKAAMAIAAPMESLSSSAQDAMRKLWLRPGDGVSMNSDRLLADAKARALAMVPGYKPPAPATFNLPGVAGKAAIRMNVDSMYFRGGDVNKGGINQVDVATIDRLAHVLSGGDTLAANDAKAHAVNGEALEKAIAQRPDGKLGVTPFLTLTEGRILQLEREAFVALFRTEAAKKRIDYTMSKGRPLREQRTDPAPTPHYIRANMAQDTALTRRVPTGQPLDGADGRRLRNSARTTALFYKIGGMFGLG
jgi:3-hydroxyacyl-CoA dehydrogenase